MDEWIVNDHPDNRCFGCSPHNPSGLKLRFRHLGPGHVEALYTAPDLLAGAPGVVHGGIQAALLDELMGVAAHHAEGIEEDDLDIATVDFRLRYRRPVPTGQELRVVGRHLRTEGRDWFMEGQILDADGEVLTRAEARWVRIR